MSFRYYFRWVKQFLDEKENAGLEVLIAYLTYIQDSGALMWVMIATLSFCCPFVVLTSNELCRLPQTSQSTNGTDYPTLENGSFGSPTNSSSTLPKSLNGSELKRGKSLTGMGSLSKGSLASSSPTDDVHVCIQCLRAIMNNKVEKIQWFTDQC